MNWTFFQLPVYFSTFSMWLMSGGNRWKDIRNILLQPFLNNPSGKLWTVILLKYDVEFLNFLRSVLNFVSLHMSRYTQWSIIFSIIWKFANSIRQHTIPYHYGAPSVFNSWCQIFWKIFFVRFSPRVGFLVTLKHKTYIQSYKKHVSSSFLAYSWTVWEIALFCFCWSHSSTVSFCWYDLLNQTDEYPVI